MCATRKCRKGKPGREGRKREQDGKWKQFRKVCRLTGRAHGMLCREAGGLLFFTYLEQILYACIPYWDIYFSARLLDEILGERRPGQLVLFMVLILGSLPLWLLADLVRGITKNSRFSFTQKQRMIFANKIMGLDYDRLEDENTHLLFKRVERETFNDGKNLTPVLRMGTFLVGDLVSMGLSVALVWEFLVGFQEKVVILGLAAAVGIFTWVSARCFAHTEKLWLKCNDEISENCLERDGYLHYFSQYARGKEIRPFLEIGNTEFIINQLRHNLGISLLPEFTIQKDLEQGILTALQVKDFQLKVWRQILYHRDKWVSREMSSFLELAVKDGNSMEN